MVTFVPCASCRRHHAVTEVACPFCRRAVDRRAVVAAMAMLGATLTGCPRQEADIYGGPPAPEPVETDSVLVPDPEPPGPVESPPQPAPTEVAPEPSPAPVGTDRQAPAYGGPPTTAVPTATAPRAPAEAYGAPPPPSLVTPEKPR